MSVRPVLVQAVTCVVGLAVVGRCHSRVCAAAAVGEQHGPRWAGSARRLV